MADTDPQVLSEIQQKQAGVDPFAQARQQAQQQQQNASVVSSSNILSGAPFGQIGAPQVPQNPMQQGMPQNPGQQQTMQQTFMPANQPQTGISPDLMQAMSKLDIPIHNVQLSQVGRSLLSSRLQQRYGDDYMSRPDVSNMMSMFDKDHAKYSDQSSARQAQSMANAGRTLAALKG